ncbi:MAG: nitrate reductase [Pseudohongiellaceae bacterium]|nr:nitrate reductase [Pseudohongiellaceae bacterium]
MNSEVKSSGQTSCPYCGVGCGVDAQIKNGTITSVSGSINHPANKGKLCVKGSSLHETLGVQGRLLYPKMAGVRTDWDSALDHVSASLKDIISKHGPNSVALYLSGQLLTEDYYVANKLMKGFVGTANVDTNSRLCMASAVAGYKRAFGSDTVPCNYEDLELCDLLIIIGANPAWAHPILFQRISAAKVARPQMKIVVIDPRKSATCEIADLHLQLKAGSDAFLFSGLLNYISSKRAVDADFVEQHTEGFELALAEARAFDLETTAETTRLDIADVEQFFKWYIRTPKTVSFYSQGINQSATGTDKCNAIINCHLATGRIGFEGAGPFSITGQPNAMGGREVGGLANQLAAHMDFDDASIDRVARFWRAPRMAKEPGLKAVDLFDAIHSGEVKAVWIMATNPAVSLPNSQKVREALDKCELVIVSDCIEHTDTNAYADILLPATGWSEKDGTVTNSDRTISRQRALLKPAGEAKHDWWIISEVAKRLGFEADFAYANPQQIFIEHAALSAFENDGTRDFDIGGLAQLSEQQYNELQAIQWPVNAQNPNGCKRMFTDHRFFTDSGKARFLSCEPRLPERPIDFQTPFTLNTGRLRDQWHTMTRTGRTSTLLSHSRTPTVSINPRDAQSLGIREGDLVHVFNKDEQEQHQSLTLAVQLDEGIAYENIFIPIHWSQQFTSNAIVSKLIAPTTDPYSGQPESKFARVGIRPIMIPLWVSIVSRKPIDTSSFEFWVKTPVPGGWHYLLADSNSQDESIWRKWMTELQDGLKKVELSNTVLHDYRSLGCSGKSIEIAIFANPQRSKLPEVIWQQALLNHQVGADTWHLLTEKQNNSISQNRIICSCFQISEQQITTAIAQGAASTKELGKKLHCGTNCGSCIPELKKFIRDSKENSTVEFESI